MAVLLALVTLVLVGPHVARAAEEVDIAGEYSCRGGNPDAGGYTGKVVITKTDQTYKIEWTIGAGQRHIGVGIREGNVLSVCFASAQGVGVVAYKIQESKDGPRLVGRWAGLGGKKTQSETLTRGSEPAEKAVPGRQQITRVSPHPSGQGGSGV